MKHKLLFLALVVLSLLSACSTTGRRTTSSRYSNREFTDRVK